jgi:hypothetical protein
MDNDMPITTAADRFVPLDPSKPYRKPRFHMKAYGLLDIPYEEVARAFATTNTIDNDVDPAWYELAETERPAPRLAGLDGNRKERRRQEALADRRS